LFLLFNGGLAIVHGFLACEDKFLAISQHYSDDRPPTLAAPPLGSISTLAWPQTAIQA
jgi:hypothetical protein